MYFSVNELVGLPGMPGTVQGVRASLKRLVINAPNMQRRREGSKAFEYYIDCLPLETQAIAREQLLKSIVCDRSRSEDDNKSSLSKAAKVSAKIEVLRNCPSLLESKISGFSDEQREVADARMVLAVEVLRLENEANMRRIHAVNFIVEQARAGDLPSHLESYVRKANAKKGTTRILGTRALNQWVLDYVRAETPLERLALLAPNICKPTPAEKITWLPMFLAHYRQTSGVSLLEAYRRFSKDWKIQYADQPAMLDALPLIDAVRRAMKKLPKITRLKGRVTGAAWTAIKTYVKRDWSQLSVNDVWIGDGHGLKMKVAHPDHGQPFVPEVTMIIDGATRFIVGWSVSLSENTIAVSDALRHGMSRHGVPLFYYSDNGGGEKNKLFDADVTGIFPRLGIGHETGIPGNPQGRGIIERSHQTILKRVAQQFHTYHGSGADRDAVRATSVQIMSAVNAQNQGKELSRAQTNALSKLPSWNQLIDALEDGINWYNTQHRHSELPKNNGKHYTPAEYRSHLLQHTELHYISDVELNEMFMPQVIRTAQRGWIDLFNNEYFSEKLIAVDGEKVSVAFDIHDPQSVIIRKLDGTLVCRAIFNGNKRAAFPVSFVDKARTERAKRRMSLVDKKAEEIRAELNPVIEANNGINFGDFITGEHSNTQKEPIFLFASEREEWRANQLKNTGIK